MHRFGAAKLSSNHIELFDKIRACSAALSCIWRIENASALGFNEQSRILEDL